LFLNWCSVQFQHDFSLRILYNVRVTYIKWRYKDRVCLSVRPYDHMFQLWNKLMKFDWISCWCLK
jgi:hypothetical protein